jgi:hypothetical protein
MPGNDMHLSSHVMVEHFRLVNPPSLRVFINLVNVLLDSLIPPFIKTEQHRFFLFAHPNNNTFCVHP